MPHRGYNDSHAAEPFSMGHLSFHRVDLWDDEFVQAERSGIN
jgi:hypothetical protein